jgi:SAM-dependent methyltransferase
VVTNGIFAPASRCLLLGSEGVRTIGKTLAWAEAGALLCAAFECSSAFPGYGADCGAIFLAAEHGGRMRLAEVSANDIVFDLGAGDGRVVIAAARKFGARGVGVEIDAALVERSRVSAARAGVDGRVRFLQQDLFKTELGEATVIALYLSPNMTLKLRPVLLGLKPGTRIVAFGGLGDWRPDRRTASRGRHAVGGPYAHCGTVARHFGPSPARDQLQRYRRNCERPSRLGVQVWTLQRRTSGCIHRNRQG